MFLRLLPVIISLRDVFFTYILSKIDLDFEQIRSKSLCAKVAAFVRAVLCHVMSCYFSFSFGFHYIAVLVKIIVDKNCRLDFTIRYPLQKNPNLKVHVNFDNGLSVRV
jgi:hypothetical protein